MIRTIATLAIVTVVALTLGCPLIPAVGEEGEGEGEGVAEGEGEGEGGEGEGEGGEGEGEGGEGEGEGEACTSNDECDLGNLCISGACTPGCEEDRDCPEALFCDTSVDNGQCVSCLIDDDCTGDEVCFEGNCATVCDGDEDCPGEICDTDNGICVECLADDGCALGNICEANSCTPGCRQDRDCPEEEVCDEAALPNGACVIGCTTAPADSCAAGLHCEGVVCELGCNNDDTRCGEGHVCRNDRCEFACVDGTDCETGSTCVDGACTGGCQIDEDCPFTAAVCDGAEGAPGACVACVDTSDCDPNNNNGLVCDGSQCRSECGTGIGINICNFSGGTCSPVDDLCVGCVDNTDCNAEAGETCNLDTRTCVAPAPTNTLCLACTADAQCGDTNQCVRIQRTDSANNFENACGIDCSAGTACPSGFECEFVDDGTGTIAGKQCVPSNSVVAFPTCDAYRDTVNAATCFVQAGALCGFDQQNAGDGVCLPPDDEANQGVCTLPCGDDADCPASFSCDPIAIAEFPVENACVAD